MIQINWWVVLIGIFWLSAGIGSMGNGETKHAFDAAMTATVCTAIIYFIFR